MGGDDGSSEEMELRPRFPLVMCKDCKIRRVRHFVSRTPENYMRHFYKCTNHGSWKGACDMWYWEDEYEDFLRTYAVKEKKEGIMKRKKHFMTDLNISDITVHIFENIREFS
ncbi:hypothetical protein D1007_60454 [Hordeum vulgare]|nr:hypothetical protein D1007_60454 [Hordeum vulgare]